MIRTITALSALLAASGLVLPQASQAEDSNSVHVSYADLNLASPIGRNVLQRRIAGAARTICVFEDSKELERALQTRDCRHDAVVRAQPAYEQAVAAAQHGTVTVLGAAALLVTNH